jgi:hypothetical protein
MSNQEQYKYIDQLLPLFGCRAITDSSSLFNKSTIVNWDKLKQKLNQDMPHIREIFPTKALNLSRTDFEINTEQQAVALLRGLLKLAGINYTVVRKSQAEFLRLNLINKDLMYYIIHTTMATTKIQMVPVNASFRPENLKPVKRFFAKFPAVPSTPSTPSDSEVPKLPEKHRFKLFIGGQEMFHTEKLVYSEQYKMWEIKFYAELFTWNKSIPDEYTDALLLNHLTWHSVKIYTNTKCDVFIEYYDVDLVLSPTLKEQSVPCGNPMDRSDPEAWDANNMQKFIKALVPVGMVNSFIRYEEPYVYDLSTNILKFNSGMAGMAFAVESLKYAEPNIEIHDPCERQNLYEEINERKQNLKYMGTIYFE